MTTPPAGHRAAVDLAAIREAWGDLLAAIDTPPRAEWPPRDSRALGVIDHGIKPDPGPTIGRMPLILREHPAPLNVDALDAALDVERAMFDLADTIAAAVQRPVRRALIQPKATFLRWGEDQADRDDPARWHYKAPTSPGSRAYGLHWAAVWLEGRALDEPAGDLFTPIPALILDDLATVAHRARQRVEKALGRDGRTTTLAEPCPWCKGELTARTQSGGEPSVSCSTGEACTAPALLDRGRRMWRGADLVGLYVAMEAAQRREEESAA
ncbi:MULTISPECIES: hypothetical protein [Streptomyces]|uniref:Uncharacterized protein n=1 Tax=Streptomyces dengpaensis TaxID=2049881 RepID=A0ABN5I5Q6_9ACTN|nr:MULTISPECIES: hypothetical protein [Streptomyces]AVH58398.1 hypothetical protein C4B68_24460 [Streptomyces dengpaensis]PIB06073.1 hypothetical protein B1C81_26180 [Streptomyces sp. HG99]